MVRRYKQGKYENKQRERQGCDKEIKKSREGQGKEAEARANEGKG